MFYYFSWRHGAFLNQREGFAWSLLNVTDLRPRFVVRCAYFVVVVCILSAGLIIMGDDQLAVLFCGRHQCYTSRSSVFRAVVGVLLLLSPLMFWCLSKMVCPPS